MRNNWKYMLIILVLMIGMHNVSDFEWFVGISAACGMLVLQASKFWHFLIVGFISTTLLLLLDAPPQIVSSTLGEIVGISGILFILITIVFTGISFALPAYLVNLFAFDIKQ